MSRRKKDWGVVEMSSGPDLSAMMNAALAGCAALQERVARMDDSEALAVIAPLIAAADPGARIRRLPWKRGLRLLASGQITLSDCRRRRWPAGDETLVL